MKKGCLFSIIIIILISAGIGYRFWSISKLEEAAKLLEAQKQGVEKHDAPRNFTVADVTGVDGKDIERIKYLLIGRSIPGWTFNYLGEFKKTVVTKFVSNDYLLEYDMIFTLEAEGYWPREARLIVVCENHYQRPGDFVSYEFKHSRFYYTVDKPTMVYPVRNCNLVFDSAAIAVQDPCNSKSYIGGGTIKTLCDSLRIVNISISPINVVLTAYPKKSRIIGNNQNYVEEEIPKPDPPALHRKTDYDSLAFDSTQ